jgi:opacity protein-like surface antigen
MKKIISLFIAALSLAVSARAFEVGASAGYLVDSEEAYFSFRSSFTLSESTAIRHSAELELGYADIAEGSIRAELFPLFANYRAEFLNNGKFSTFLGAGAGATYVKFRSWLLRDEDITFAAQAFGGIKYRATERVSLNLGLRYLWFNDANTYRGDIEIGDDVAVEAGISFKF